MPVTVDLEQAERYKNYCPYALKNHNGDVIAYVFGPFAAVATEIIAKALETTPDRDLPDSRAVFERNDRQDGRTRQWNREKQRFDVFIHGVLQHDENDD